MSKAGAKERHRVLDAARRTIVSGDRFRQILHQIQRVVLTARELKRNPKQSLILCYKQLGKFLLHEWFPPREKAYRRHANPATDRSEPSYHYSPTET